MTTAERNFSLNRFAEFAGENSRDPAHIYGGEGGMTWRDVRVMGWKEAGGVTV